MGKIYLNYDFREDETCKGKDPDGYSEKLSNSHLELWKKKLPNGDFFDLTNNNDEGLWRLLYKKDYRFSSDLMVNSYMYEDDTWAEIKDNINISNSEKIKFNYETYTIGNFIIFPLKPSCAHNIDCRYTINCVRGKKNGQIKDRFDLTLECIRLYYNKQDNPLYEVLDSYDWFFNFFIKNKETSGTDNFKEYCDFFFLQDLVSKDYSKVNFFLDFNDFSSDCLPKNEEEYNRFKEKAIDFINKRHERIAEYAKNKNI